MCYNNEETWQNKLEEIHKFQRKETRLNVSEEQAKMLIELYKKYKHIFSNTPGKLKNCQCKLKFREPVEFHRKSYPVAHSIKDAVRKEINKMIADYIVIVLNIVTLHTTTAVSYTHLDVYKRQASNSLMARQPVRA